MGMKLVELFMLYVVVRRPTPCISGPPLNQDSSAHLPEEEVVRIQLCVAPRLYRRELEFADADTSAKEGMSKSALRKSILIEILP